MQLNKYKRYRNVPLYFLYHYVIMEGVEIMLFDSSLQVGDVCIYDPKNTKKEKLAFSTTVVVILDEGQTEDTFKCADHNFKTIMDLEKSLLKKIDMKKAMSNVIVRFPNNTPEFSKSDTDNLSVVIASLQASIPTGVLSDNEQVAINALIESLNRLKLKIEFYNEFDKQNVV